MAKIEDLERFSDEGLEIVQSLLLMESKEDIVLEIERIRKEREERKGKSLNDLFLVDQLNIDKEYIERLKRHGIFNQTQLLEANLDLISVEGSEARNQYEYARKMFDFSDEEKKEEEIGRPLTVSERAKIIVEQVNGSAKVKGK